MATITASLTTVRYYTALDPYYYTVDNRPLTDIASNVSLIATYLDSRYNINSSASATPTLDLSLYSIFILSPIANITAITISNPKATGRNEFYIVFTQDSSPRTITWPASVHWPAGSSPSLTGTSGKRDIFKFTSIDGGTVFYGTTVGQNYTA